MNRRRFIAAIAAAWTWLFGKRPRKRVFFTGPRVVWVSNLKLEPLYVRKSWFCHPIPMTPELIDDCVMMSESEKARRKRIYEEWRKQFTNA